VVDTFTGAAQAVIQAWQKAMNWITDRIFDMASRKASSGPRWLSFGV